MPYPCMQLRRCALYSSRKSLLLHLRLLPPDTCMSRSKRNETPRAVGWVRNTRLTAKPVLAASAAQFPPVVVLRILPREINLMTRTPL
ncbi:hypothetical protein GW17_00005924 [Ensete ventricosum]|nr:hypothetical protein GW17_00005924 [Ensete ventricosum]